MDSVDAISLISYVVMLCYATSRRQLKYAATGTMMGIHDVFPPSEDDSTDPISNKKLRKGEGTFETSKCLLGFEFDDVNKPYGSKTKNGPPSCKSYTNGSTEQQKENGAYPSLSLSQS